MITNALSFNYLLDAPANPSQSVSTPDKQSFLSKSQPINIPQARVNASANDDLSLPPREFFLNRMNVASENILGTKPSQRLSGDAGPRGVALLSAFDDAFMFPMDLDTEAASTSETPTRQLSNMSSLTADSNSSAMSNSLLTQFFKGNNS